MAQYGRNMTAKPRFFQSMAAWTYLVKSAQVQVKESVTSDDLDWTKNITHGGYPDGDLRQRPNL